MTISPITRGFLESALKHHKEGKEFKPNWFIASWAMGECPIILRDVIDIDSEKVVSLNDPEIVRIYLDMMSL